MLKKSKSVLNDFVRIIMLLSLLCVFWISSVIGQAKFQTGTYSSGEFAITFNEDGSHTVSVNDNVAVKGSYTVTGDEIVLTDKEGQFACDGSLSGKYKWKLNENNLMFEKIEDGCDGRAAALSGQTWVKK